MRGEKDGPGASPQPQLCLARALECQQMCSHSDSPQDCLLVKHSIKTSSIHLFLKTKSESLLLLMLLETMRLLREQQTKSSTWPAASPNFNDGSRGPSMGNHRVRQTGVQPICAPVRPTACPAAKPPCGPGSRQVRSPEPSLA